MARTSFSGCSKVAGVATGIVTANEPVAYRHLSFSGGLLLPITILGTGAGGSTAAACLVVQRLTTAVNSWPATMPLGRSTVSRLAKFCADVLDGTGMYDVLPTPTLRIASVCSSGAVKSCVAYSLLAASITSVACTPGQYTEAVLPVGTLPQSITSSSGQFSRSPAVARARLKGALGRISNVWGTRCAAGGPGLSAGVISKLRWASCALLATLVLVLIGVPE